MTRRSYFLPELYRSTWPPPSPFLQPEQFRNTISGRANFELDIVHSHRTCRLTCIVTTTRLLSKHPEYRSGFRSPRYILVGALCSRLCCIHPDSRVLCTLIKHTFHDTVCTRQHKLEQEYSLRLQQPQFSSQNFQNYSQLTAHQPLMTLRDIVGTGVFCHWHWLP